MKYIFKLFLFLIITLGIFVPSYNVASDDVVQCRTLQAEGYFFDAFESVEYVNGFLVTHFKLKPQYADGRTWSTNGLYLFNPNCLQTEFFNPVKRISLPAQLKNYSIRFTSQTHYDFWDDEQDKKLECEGCSVDIISDTEISSVSFSGTIDGTASYIYSGSYPITGLVKKKNPVIFVPGILGTELKFNQEKLWPDVNRMALTNDSFMSLMSFDFSGKPIDPTVTTAEVITKIDYPFGSYHYSDLLIQELLNQGYTLGKDLFLFPYDWRFGVEHNSKFLKTKIDDILNLTDATQIDLIAHSLGGLVVKKYLYDLPLDQENKIGKSIFIAVPNLGSAEAGKALIFGSNLGVPLLNTETIHNLAQNMPSIYDLLPSQEYFKNIIGYYDDLNDSSIRTILNYQQTKDLLFSLGKNQSLFQGSEQLHTQVFDNLDLSTKPYKTYNIIGCGSFTLKTITKTYSGTSNVIKPKYKIYPDTGDGTVLSASAKRLGVSSQNTFYAQNVIHGTMPSATGVRELVVSLLADNLVTKENISRNDSNCPVQGKLLSFKTNLDIKIKDLKNNQYVSPNLDLVEQRVGEDVHIFVPTKSGGKYQIEAKPKTPDVKFADVAITKIDNSVQGTLNYNNVKVENSTLNINIDELQNQIQVVDPTGAITDIPPSPEQLDPAITDAPVIIQPQINNIGTIPNTTEEEDEEVELEIDKDSLIGDINIVLQNPEPKIYYFNAPQYKENLNNPTPSQIIVNKTEIDIKNYAQKILSYLKFAWKLMQL